MTDFDYYITELTAAFDVLGVHKTKHALTDAAEKLTGFLTKLDIALMKPAIADMTQNITKLNTSKDEDLAAISATRGKAAEGLFWLMLGMRYVVQFLSRLVQSKDVRSSLRLAYDDVLSSHHNMVLKGAFFVGFQFAPEYEEVLYKTGLVVDGTLENKIGDIYQCVGDVWELIQ